MLDRNGARGITTVQGQARPTGPPPNTSRAAPAHDFLNPRLGHHTAQPAHRPCNKRSHLAPLLEQTLWPYSQQARAAPVETTLGQIGLTTYLRLGASRYLNRGTHLVSKGSSQRGANTAPHGLPIITQTPCPNTFASRPARNLHRIHPLTHRLILPESHSGAQARRRAIPADQWPFNVDTALNGQTTAGTWRSSGVSTAARPHQSLHQLAGTTAKGTKPHTPGFDQLKSRADTGHPASQPSWGKPSIPPAYPLRNMRTQGRGGPFAKLSPPNGNSPDQVPSDPQPPCPLEAGQRQPASRASSRPAHRRNCTAQTLNDPPGKHQPAARDSRSVCPLARRRPPGRGTPPASTNQNQRNTDNHLATKCAQPNAVPRAAKSNIPVILLQSPSYPQSQGAGSICTQPRYLKCEQTPRHHKARGGGASSPLKYLICLQTVPGKRR